MVRNIFKINIQDILQSKIQNIFLLITHTFKAEIEAKLTTMEPSGTQRTRHNNMYIYMQSNQRPTRSCRLAFAPIGLF